MTGNISIVKIQNGNTFTDVNYVRPINPWKHR